jgi:FtsH-binding integral membrane protein
VEAMAEYSDMSEVPSGTLFKNVPEHQMQMVRNGFIKKVYGIVAVQLALTAVIAGYISQTVTPEIMIKYLQPAVAVSAGGTVAIICYISCNPAVMKKVPTNYIILLVFTVLESVLVGVICCAYQTQSVVLAFGVTMAIFLGLTAYAFTTKNDFTGMGGYLFAGLLGLFICGLIFCLFPSEHAMVIQAGFGAILFSFYIVYDTQLIMGGNHKKHQFAIDDYCWAALNIYLDIINLFIYILQLLGDKKN